MGQLLKSLKKYCIKYLQAHGNMISLPLPSDILLPPPKHKLIRFVGLETVPKFVNDGIILAKIANADGLSEAQVGAQRFAQILEGENAPLRHLSHQKLHNTQQLVHCLSESDS